MQVEGLLSTGRAPLGRLAQPAFVNEWAQFQFEYAWLWRKAREPGGLSHPSAVPYETVEGNERAFVRELAFRMIDYLTFYGQATLLSLTQTGQVIIDGVIDVDRGELVNPRGGYPLKNKLVNGGWVKIETPLLNLLAWEHHEAWMAAREAMEILAEELQDASLSRGRRAEHKSIDRDSPDLDRDRGNIYGLAFCFAAMLQLNPAMHARFLEIAKNR